jgi:hypothetical protein
MQAPCALTETPALAVGAGAGFAGIVARESPSGLLIALLDSAAGALRATSGCGARGAAELGSPAATGSADAGPARNASAPTLNGVVANAVVAVVAAVAAVAAGVVASSVIAVAGKAERTSMA